jgi:hypothetical protein
MPDTTQAYSLLPWVRRGLGIQVAGTPAVNYATISVSLAVNNNPVTAPQVRLPGPGDVKTVDVRAFIRTDPVDGADNFEPNYLPIVELATPDLPWLFTPSGANGARLQPWICLIVIPDGDGVTLTGQAGAPAKLVIDAPLNPVDELSDLSQADAWAHAQVTGSDLSSLNGDNTATLSRLIAPRRLKPSQQYLACVVPTFRAGVHAGLGLPVSDNDLAPAWDATITAPFTLPVFFSFRFQTGPGGDFASLVKAIGPPTQPFSAGMRTMDVSQPGFGAAPAAGVTLGLEGALRTFGMVDTPWPAGAQAAYEAQLRSALASPAAADPVVTPPTYGRSQSGDSLPSPGQQPIWLGELNLDPRTRVAAGMGGQVVQADAEAMVASAWDQLGEIRKANQLFRRAQLAREVSASMYHRHLQSIDGDGVYLQVTGPLHARVSLALAGATATITGHIDVSRIPGSAVTSGMRKLARPRGALGRQLAVTGPQQIVDRLNVPIGSVTPGAGTSGMVVCGPARAPAGMIALDSISPAIQVSKMSSSILSSAPGWLKTTVTKKPIEDTVALRPPMPPIPIKVPVINWGGDTNVPPILKSGAKSTPAVFAFPTNDADLAKVEASFRTASAAINGYLNIGDAPTPDPPSLGGTPALTSTRAMLHAALDPRITIQARFGARIPIGTGSDPLQPLSRSPQFPQAMYEPLAALSPEWMLPGISSLPRNNAVLLQTNPRFIEAYMVGLNEDLARELLWRQFPSQRNSTWFQNFWSFQGPQDIPVIAQFDPAGHLGDHTQDHAEPGRVVLLVRADLFRRYPNVLVSACPAVWLGATRALGTTRQWPIFQGQIGTDCRFFGFDIPDPFGSPDPAAKDPGVYFVLEEHITEPRFGLEPPGSVPPPNPSWNDLGWDQVTTAGNFLSATKAPAFTASEPVVWSEDASAMAFILMRRPVRVAMHATALVAEEHA